MDKPKYWVKNAIKKCTIESWVKTWNYIFNPTFGFVHILPTFRFNNPASFRV